ncbi:MAG TPA: right-handed parallel beta-helix repeat-containing protein [Thermoanaerobaculia bacterium]|nr:right-handed parallel beta-helix repeat-containing protein [Thermoanaerobaculia bacterium]
MRRHFQLIPAGLLALGLAFAAPVAAQSDSEELIFEAERGPHPVARPIVITRPGSYYLVRNIDSYGNQPVIRILADRVTLDLRGHSLRGPGERQGTGVLIEGASDVRVFGGHLSRFGIGVQVVGGTNVAVEGLQIDGEDKGGAPPDVEIGIMLVETRGARIVSNTITETFLGIFVRGDGSSGNLVADNVVTGGDNGELAICYNPAPGQPGGGPHGDLVTGNVMTRYRRGLSLSADTSGNVVRDNTIAYFDFSIQEATPGTNLIEDNHEIQILP